MILIFFFITFELCSFAPCIFPNVWQFLKFAIVIFCLLDPQHPRNLKGEAGVDGIKLTWEPPSYPSLKKIHYYKIERRTNGKTDILNSSEKKNYYLMSDVLPSQTYSFAIKTCCSTSDKECESNFSVSINCTAKSNLSNSFNWLLVSVLDFTTGLLQKLLILF